MNRLALLIGAAVLLTACGQDASVNETNATVAEVSESVREASREQGLIRPGKWASTVTIEEMSVPGMPPETAERMEAMLQQSRTAEVCLTEEEAARPDANFFAGNEQCRYDRFTMAGGEIEALMRCSEGETTQVMEMAGTYSPTDYDMRMVSKTLGGPAGEAMTLQMRVRSQRVGKCDKEQN